jgi:endonuclease YncB( thermonuclease family)
MPVSCTTVSLDQYGRTIATWSVDSADLGQWLVSNGLALDWPNYSHGMYDKISIVSPSITLACPVRSSAGT